MMEEQKKISVITPSYNDGDTLELHIQTFIDQDYTNKELVIVDDGSKDNSRSIIEKYVKKYPKLVKGIYFPKNRGACVARNWGAKESSGDIYSFLPADSFLKPGMLRYWAESLEEHPDYAFLYGGYAFVKDPKPTWMGGQIADNYFSQSFDARELETANYIDGSFPIRKEVFWDTAKLMGLKDGLWNPDVKSLQDWDFWLSVVKDAGLKGYYVNSIFFETTLPHAGGLSFDSDRNWVARNKQIKALHKIPNREVCVTSLFAPFHGQSVAKLLDADFVPFPPQKAHDYKMIYEIGFFPASFMDSASVFLKPEHFRRMGQMMERGESPAFYGGAKLIHWIGSDVLQLSKLSFEQLKLIKEFTLKCEGVLCELPAIQKELKTFGIEADVVPFPPRKWYDVTPLPEKKAVAIYMPKVNEDFYFRKLFLGYEGKKGLAAKMKDIDFYFFGAEKAEPAKNVHCLGVVDGVGEVIEKTRAIVRIVPHDGLSISVAEWIGAGRNAVTSVKMPNADYFDLHEFVKSYGKAFSMDQLEKEIGRVIRVVVEKPLNEEGAKYYREWLDADKYKKTIKSYLEYDEEKYWNRRAWNWKDHESYDYPIKKESINRFLKQINPKSVLDLGCGDGAWSRFFQDYDYTGCDVSDKMIEFARENNPKAKFTTLSAEEVDKIGRKFDLIFSCTTLEHIKPENMAKTIAAMKKVGKWLILIEPKEFTPQGNYCFDHDYGKLFKVIKRKSIDVWRNAYLINLS